MPRELNAKQQAEAASRRPDVCRIFAKIWESEVEVRSYETDKPIFASLSREYPGPFGLWDFIPGPSNEDGVFIIKNLGLNGFIVADEDDQVVVGPSNRPLEFRVQPDEDGYVQIKLKDEDKLWTLSGEGLKRTISLQGANGSPEQKFRQVVADE